MLKDLQNKVSIYNTLNNRKEKFVPLKAGKIKMYVCGPTVYDFIHISLKDLSKNMKSTVKRSMSKKLIFVRELPKLCPKL